MPQPLPGIQHVVLLMFENRSFDNMLGAFYPGTSSGGGVPAGWSNPGPGGTTVAAWQAPAGAQAQIIPFPDPQEEFVHMTAQIMTTPPMMGFVNDYASVSGATAANIMQYYIAANVPVTQALAARYVVSDQYFASGPVQTWPNRLFSLCGSPAYDISAHTPYVNNTEYPDYPLLIGQITRQQFPSIFDQIDQTHGLSWKVYYGDEAPIAALLSTVWENWDPILDDGKAVYLDNFFKDVRENKLPTFSLIEPRYQMLSFEGFEAPTSNHPGDSLAVGNADVPINISCGERLLAQVFNALAGNQGLFDQTLLIVTYDEHGGLFDHVTPPPAQSPFPGGGVLGFQYDRYGVRVPALFVNPYVQRSQPGSPAGVFRPPQPPPTPAYPFDHTSLLATLQAQFNLAGPPLSARSKAAPTFTGLVSPSNPKISTQTVPLPTCSWSADGVRTGHATGVLRSGLISAQRAGILRSRSRKMKQLKTN
jgi:phospholipase C